MQNRMQRDKPRFNQADSARGTDHNRPPWGNSKLTAYIDWSMATLAFASRN
jgi:hypothetical protein